MIKILEDRNSCDLMIYQQVVKCELKQEEHENNIKY